MLLILSHRPPLKHKRKMNETRGGENFSSFLLFLGFCYLHEAVVVPLRNELSVFVAWQCKSLQEIYFPHVNWGKRKKEKCERGGRERELLSNWKEMTWKGTTTVEGMKAMNVSLARITRIVHFIASSSPSRRLLRSFLSS